MALAAEHPDTAPEQQGAEDVDDPLEALQQLRAGGDERAAQHERAEDAVEEHAVLIGGRDREGAEDQRPDEHVVERERLLEQVAGEELRADVATLNHEQRDAERDADGDESRRRPGGVAHRNLVRAPMEDEQVEQQQHGETGRQRGPGRERRVHKPMPLPDSRLARGRRLSLGVGTGHGGAPA